MIGIVVSNSTITLNALAKLIEGSFDRIIKLGHLPGENELDWEDGVTIVDLDAPAVSIPLLRKIPRAALARTIVLTKAVHDVRDLAPLVGEVGAILPHSSDLEEVGLVARLVRHGIALLPSEMVQLLWNPDARPALPPVTAMSALTARENAVLDLIAQGSNNKAIAATLGIHPTTVRVHVRSVLRKIGVNNRTQAALMVARSGARTQQPNGGELLDMSARTGQREADNDVRVFASMEAQA